MQNAGDHERFTVQGLRTAYAHGALTPTDVADLVLDRLAARGDDHVWITTVTPDALRERAAALTALAGRMAELPLYGVPFAVKDNIDVAGLPTTAACPDFAYVPARTAPVVERLLAAGALLVGKTNMDQFAAGLNGIRSPYGAVESVFGGGLIAGGSSSGSAVAVAAGQVAFSLGTDTAGSGRVPAALNGIVGLKPTRGLLSTTGVVPACRSLDCVSVFAHDVADARAVAEVARNVDPADPWSRSSDAVRPVPPSAIRLGVPHDVDLDFSGDLGQHDRFADARDRVTGIVAQVVPIELGPLLEAGDLLYQGPWVAERLATLEGFLEVNGDSVLPVTRGIIGSGAAYSAVDAFRARHRLQELLAWAATLWQHVDAVLLPTVGTTFTVGEIADEPVRHNTTLGRYTQFVNLLDLAAIAVPNGFTGDRRPAGVSFIGPAFSDATLARLAEAFTGPVATPHSNRTRYGGAGETVTIAVAGRHLSGESRNGELLQRQASLVKVARTTVHYRLYRLPVDDEGLPGLVRVGDGGTAIEIELWRMPAAELAGFLAGVPAPLSLGWVRIDDGSTVLGFLCEAVGTAGAEDISASGGWRAYRRALTT